MCWITPRVRFVLSWPGRFRLVEDLNPECLGFKSSTNRNLPGQLRTNQTRGVNQHNSLLIRKDKEITYLRTNRTRGVNQPDYYKCLWCSILICIWFYGKFRELDQCLIGNFFLRSRYNQGFSDGRDSQSRLNYDRDQSKYDQGFIDGMKAKVRDAMNL